MLPRFARSRAGSRRSSSLAAQLPSSGLWICRVRPLACKICAARPSASVRVRDLGFASTAVPARPALSVPVAVGVAVIHGGAVDTTASSSPDEIYFSVVQRKVVSPNDFYDLTDVENRLTAFQDLYNAAARPFNWKYTTKDLNALLARIATHERNPQLALAA